MEYAVFEKNDHIYMVPQGGKHTHLLIFLHGFGDYAKSYESFFEQESFLPKNISVKIILLQAPISFSGMFPVPVPSWFNITQFPIVSEKCYDFKEAQKNAKIIENIIEEEVKFLNGKYENIYVGGFSQGACLSLYTGLTYKHLLGGVLSFSGALFAQTKVLESNKDLKIFLGHGFEDDVIPYKVHIESLKPIENFTGLNKSYIPKHAHGIHPQEIKDAKMFLEKCMTGK